MGFMDLQSLSLFLFLECSDVLMNVFLLFVLDGLQLWRALGETSHSSMSLYGQLQDWERVLGSDDRVSNTR